MPVGSPDDGACGACGLPAAEHGWPRDRRLGQLVAGRQYKVIRRLGSGGFGTVYLVETVVGGLRRALKVLHADWTGDAQMRERFVHEAVVLEQVNHPNIARCFAAGVLDEEQEPYLLLEYVDGVPVSTLVAPALAGDTRQPLPPARAVRLAKLVAAGLAAAHARHVVHRDIKPENVLVVGAGTPDENAKLIDFGIARSLDLTLASGHHVLGTPQYLAPEQLRDGQGICDHRVDLWQLGATLHFMLTGRPPYAVPSGGFDGLSDLHRSHADVGPLPSRANPALAAYPRLETLVSRLLATRPAARPRSAAQVCAELARIEHGLAPATEAGSLALLEALCARPSEAAWWALCRYLSDQGPDAERLIATAESLLTDWPDHWRIAAVGWWDAERRGDPHPLWPLARTLDLSHQGLTDDDVAELAACPRLSTLRTLRLRGNGIGNEAVIALASSSVLSQISSLDLAGNRVTSAGVEALAASTTLSALARLNVSGNGLGSRAIQALARSELRLRELDLSDNDLGPDAAVALAESGAMASLESLNLRGTRVGSDGAGAIAVSRSLHALERLDLSATGLGPSGLAALALSGNTSRVRALALAQNALGPQALELLFASNRFPLLDTLDLSSNACGAPGGMAVASAPFARRLRTLSLRDNALGDAGLAALLGSHHLAALRQLDVGQNGLTAAAMSLLGSAPQELTDLDLSHNPLGREGARAIAAALPRIRLRSLRVEGCEFDGADLAALLAGGGGRIERLDAARNAIGVEGARQIGATTEAATLHALDLGRTQLGADGIGEIGRAPHLKAVRTLAVDGNGLDDARGPEMVRALDLLPNLQDLHLAENGLGPATAVALAAAPLSARLVALDLAHNRLGDAGAAALSRGGTWFVLHDLDLQGNEIALGAAASILAAPGMALLARVNLSHNALAEGLVDLHSLAEDTVTRLESSFARLAAQGMDFAERFYAEYFRRQPSVKPLFAQASIRRQQHHLMAMLAMVIDHLRHPDVATRSLEELGSRHVQYGASASHYVTMTPVLLDAMRQTLGEAWTPEVAEAWREGLDAISSVMMQAHRGGR
jgi:hemoglobin-like flavoprotein/Ran GTPase-activating protein (RanGAP) involved in mRNA processing and transport/tRNA A-37 threonylcarbamoyl transferase component Bud32